MLFDTTILVDYLRGRAEARDLLEALGNKPNISVASTLELYAGVRRRRNELLTEQILSQVALLPVTQDIAKRAGVFVRLYQATTVSRASTPSSPRQPSIPAQARHAQCQALPDVSQAQAQLLSGLACAALACAASAVRVLGRAVRAGGRRLLQDIDVARGAEKVAQAPARGEGELPAENAVARIESPFCRAHGHASGLLEQRCPAMPAEVPGFGEALPTSPGAGEKNAGDQLRLLRRCTAGRPPARRPIDGRPASPGTPPRPP